MEKSKQSSGWSWIPTLYFAEGLPYVVVMTVSVIMYKRLGVSNTDIALYTSWLYLPWVIKPFWSPFVDLIKTKRWWIVIMQLIIGTGLGGVALTIPTSSFFQYSLAFLWLVAFSSATHDIAADGFYMLGLSENKQAYFVGIRSTFYRLAMITGQGLLIILAGSIESKTGLQPITFEVQTTQELIDNNFDNNTELKNIGDFLISEDISTLSVQNIQKDTFSKTLNLFKEENLKNNFTKKENIQSASPSWWTTSVSKPLKHQLKSLFKENKQPNTTSSNTKGNIAFVAVSLKKQPKINEPVILNFDRKKGDKNLSIIEGKRLVFSAENWNKKAWIVVQADPKLNKATSATFEGLSGNIPMAWSITFYVMAGLFLLFVLYHKIMLPKPSSDVSSGKGKSIIKEFWQTFVSFFRKDNVGIAVTFFLLFRLGESQLVKLASPFLLDNKETGGLGLTTGDVGIVYGTIGILALTIGGILGGWLASKKGLKYWIWWMTLAINLPNLTYVYLSVFTPESFWIISSCVAIEQFGYGFGFTAFMLYMIYFAEGKNKTAHFAICTGIMALGMMIPGMISGWLQDIIGYKNFFIWVMICTIPGFLIIRFLKIDKEFGIKKQEAKG